MRSRSTPGAAPTSRTSCSSPSATRTRARLQDRDELPQRARNPQRGQRRHRGQRAAVPQEPGSPPRNVARVKPAFIELNDSNQQALFITQRILELRDEGIELDEIAVLYRAHYHSMELQIELTRHGVPFQITSGLRFFEQAHIKDVASFLKFGANHRDEVAFKRIVRLLPGVGGVAADKIWAHFEKGARRPGRGGLVHRRARHRQGRREEREDRGGSSSTRWRRSPRAASSIASVERHRKRSSRRCTMITRRRSFPTTRCAKRNSSCSPTTRVSTRDPAEFSIAIGAGDGVGNRGRPSTPAARNAKRRRVTLSSIHQAKGLEWRVVFVIHLTEGSFPSNRSLESQAAIEEERRLFYVAVTRACDELYLTYPYMKSQRRLRRHVPAAVAFPAGGADGIGGEVGDRAGVVVLSAVRNGVCAIMKYCVATCRP